MWQTLANWILSRWLELGTLAVSVTALWHSHKANRAVERGNRPQIKFHLVCRQFSLQERKADLELIVSNLSLQGNTLTKVRLSLMDGPPTLMEVHIKDHVGLEIPFDVLKPTKLKQLLEEGASIETTPTDPDRPIKSIGAAAVTNEFKPPLSLPPMSSVGARVVFELPDVLPEYAFDSLRLWIQARDVHGSLWDEMVPLVEGVVESCHI